MSIVIVQGTFKGIATSEHRPVFDLPTHAEDHRIPNRAYRALDGAEDSKLGPVLVSLANPLKQVLS
jgi:hypothetical protein